MVKIEKINGFNPDDVINSKCFSLHYYNVSSAYKSVKVNLENQGYKGDFKLLLKFIKTI